MNVLVDSSVWINHLRGQTTPAVLRLRGWLQSAEHALLAADLVALEVTRGCRTEREFRAVQAMFLSMECVTLGGLDASLRAAALYRRMRERGITVAKTVDLLIASWCIHEGVALLHDDVDFEAFKTYKLRIV